MKFCIHFFLALFICVPQAQSQNWNVLPSSTDTLHFFSNAGVTVSLLADSAHQAGIEVALFPPKELLFFDNPQGMCDGNVYGPSFCGDVNYQNSNATIFVFGQDSLVLNRSTATQSAVIYGEAIQIANQGVQWDTLPNGTQDSVFTFLLSAATSSDIGACVHQSKIKIAKQHGLVQFPACFKEYRMYAHGGFSAKTRLGAVSQTDFDTYNVSSFFDYNIGDELHYRRFVNGGTSSHSTTEDYVKRVDAKSVYADRIVYEFTIYGQRTNPVTGTTQFSHKKTEAFKNELFAFRPSGANNPDNTLPEKARIVCNKGGGQELNVISDMVWVEDSCMYDVHYAKIYKMLNYKYERGIGLTGISEEVYLGLPSTTTLVYFSIKGNTSGTPHTFALEEMLLPKVSFHPNPTRQFLNVELSIKNQELPFEITDISGRKVAFGVLNYEDSQIDLSALRSGIYILRISGFAPTRVHKIN